MLHAPHSHTSVYLGIYRGHDLYYDDQGGLPTVIARFGDQLHDYRSGLCLADFDHALAVAKERAMERGLLTVEDIEDATEFDDEVASCPACCAVAGEGSTEWTLDVCEVHYRDLVDDSIVRH